MRKNAKAKLTKAQCNKKIRTVLLKYQIDLSKLSYSATNRSIYMVGLLVKNNGFDLPNQVVIELVEELQAHGHIRSDLENWHITSDSISFTGSSYEQDCNSESAA